jgi:hypothetical protein
VTVSMSLHEKATGNMATGTACYSDANSSGSLPCLDGHTAQAVWLFEAINAARNKYFVDPRREARGWRVMPVIAAEQQVRACGACTPH